MTNHTTPVASPVSAEPVDKAAEKEKFIEWSQVFHRNARSYTARDFDHGFAGRLARARLAAPLGSEAQADRSGVELHNAIMNLPDNGGAYEGRERTVYKIGYRDARHAAAELAIAAPSAQMGSAQEAPPELSDGGIDEVWNTMPGGSDGWLKQFGYRQFARSIARHVLVRVAASMAGTIRPTDDELWEQTIGERDNNHEWADKLAGAIANHFDAEIGEHSNMNCPWAEALEVIEGAQAATATPDTTPPNAQVLADEAALYRDLTGDAMKLGYDGIPAALEALRAPASQAEQLKLPEDFDHRELRKIVANFHYGETTATDFLKAISRLNTATASQEGETASLLDWAVERWTAEVANRPLRNVHRRSLDDTWRQVIRHAGGDDVLLIGPRHDDLLAASDTATSSTASAQSAHLAHDNNGTGCVELASSAQAAAEVRTGAARDVLAERRRQMEKEGWTPAHDDQYRMGELSTAAACYALTGNIDVRADVPKIWPWAGEWWKPADDRCNLVKAAALILADIERIDRVALRSPAGEDKAAGQEGANL